MQRAASLLSYKSFNFQINPNRSLARNSLMADLGLIVSLVRILNLTQKIAGKDE